MNNGIAVNCEIVGLLFFLFSYCKLRLVALLPIYKLLENNVRVNFPLSLKHNIPTGSKLNKYQLKMHHDYKTVNIFTLLFEKIIAKTRTEKVQFTWNNHGRSNISVKVF